MLVIVREGGDCCGGRMVQRKLEMPAARRESHAQRGGRREHTSLYGVQRWIAKR